MEEAEQRQLDEALRLSVLAGDQTAWCSLYYRCFDRLYGYVFARCGRHVQRTEDVVQESWLVAVRRIQDFDPARGSFEQWMFGIANKVLMNHQRRWQRRDCGEVREEAEASIPASQDAFALRDQIAAAYATLPDNHQAVLREKYECQRSVAEIACAWGATGKAVESLLTRARQGFREAFRALEE